MASALLWHRIQFGFTIVYHYLFPQLTMGLALLLVVFKALALRTKDEKYNDLARFWLRVFAVNFVVGVVTGIPMEFQFGTNWARFSKFTGSIIGQTLAMEGMFAFFLESTFLGLLLYGEKRLGPKKHFLVACALLVGSWLSGYFIIATNAFMQHPQGHVLDAEGRLLLADLWAFVFNPWALVAYAHNMIASVVTASFVVTAVGAYWMLRDRHAEHRTRMLRVSLVAALISSVLVAFPTGDQQAKMVAEHQPAALAAMEGRFTTDRNAPLTLIGQPNVQERRLDNPIHVPGALSFLAFGTFHSEVAGLDQFPPEDWPTNIELLYYAFHVMAGLGTMIGLTALANLLFWRGALSRFRVVQWALLLAFPAPYIATTAGWMTTELGRQPWLVYGLMRTADGTSPRVHTGETLFTLIGFAAIYLVVGILYVLLVGRDIARGPLPAAKESHG